MSNAKRSKSTQPRICFYFADKHDRADISERIEAIRVNLTGGLGSPTNCDALKEIFSFYEALLSMSTKNHSSRYPGRS